MSEAGTEVRPERIMELSRRLSAVAAEKVGEIAAVNRMAKMLSINALIAASRAGEAGRGFAIVAEEFKKISSEIDVVASGLEREVGADLNELTQIGGSILGHLRGQRLADLALNAIDIVDRNLYERTCDVRWWATDSAVVACLAEPDRSSAAHASSRLGVILGAYTVYLDLWICDTAGRVVASGRPDAYPDVADASVSGSDWFKAALRTASGDEFAACNVETVAALDNAAVATYATAIRAGGRADGRVLGVLGIHFDWRPQAKAVMDGVRLTAEERTRSRIMILDSNKRIIASSDERGELREIVSVDTSGGAMGAYSTEEAIIGYALTPGYETYKGLGWYGCVVQRKMPAQPASEAPASRSAAAPTRPYASAGHLSHAH